MVCEHLVVLEQALVAAAIPVTYRGQAWSANCREWIYFACYLVRPALRARYTFAPCVADHEHRGTHDGMEAGFVCIQYHDAVLSVHESQQKWYKTFRGE